jgi:hypothetical protein
MYYRNITQVEKGIFLPSSIAERLTGHYVTGKFPGINEFPRK